MGGCSPYREYGGRVLERFSWEATSAGLIRRLRGVRLLRVLPHVHRKYRYRSGWESNPRLIVGPVQHVADSAQAQVVLRPVTEKKNLTIFPIFSNEYTAEPTVRADLSPLVPPKNP